jgi:hypothetical protein
LSSGADYFDIDDVDLVDQYYDDIFRDTLRTQSGILSDFDIVGGEAGIAGRPEASDTIRVDKNTYFSQVDAPDYLRNFRAPATQESAVSAYSSIANLQNTSDIASALSNYYGYEITPTEQNLGRRFGGNLQSHTGTSIARLTEFHSLVEPILSEQLPYLQTVEGLSYEDALIESYKRDPMLQSLYAKYDVTPIRQTDDGSTYLYDPFTFGEIRTLEVKDPSIGDIVASVLPTLALSAILGPAASGIVGGLGATGTTANVLSSALASAASAGIQGADLEDALKAGLISGGLTYAGDAISGLREGGQAGAIDPSAPELTFDPRDPTVPNNIIDIAGDPSAFEGIDIGDFTPETVASPLTNAQHFTNTIGRIVEDVGGNAAYEALSPDQFGQQLLKHGGERAYRQIFEYSGNPKSLVNIPDEIINLAGGIGSALPDYIMSTEMEGFTRPPASRTETIVDVSDLELPEERFEPIRPQQPTQMPGGGGGASGGAASAPATSVVSPSAPSATVTPVVPQPTFAAPGSITSSLFSSFAPALAAAAVAPQPTVAPPITPVATTAPTSEPTPPTTTQPTDILEDTTAEDTTAQMEAEAEAQRQAQEEAQRQAQAEAARLAEEARKASEARAAAEAKAAAEQEAIAQAEARADAAEAARAAAEAQAKADAAAAEARYGEAVAAGEALGEAQYGEGLGTGRGQGAGAGIGAGLGLGLLAGMGGGAGGTGGYTPPDFEDYQFRKTYQAPELLELAPQYESYKAPTLQGLFRGFI